MFSTLQLSVDKRVATVTLTRADVHNAMSEQMIIELAQAFNTLAQDPNVRVIVLASEGKSFCAGADLNDMKKMASYSRDENLSDAKQLATCLQTINRCPKPVIAKVQGAVFGGGCGLTACADIVVASERAKFCFSEVKLGLIPAVISSFVEAKIGVGAMRRYFVSAEVFGAARAFELGLVHEVVGADSLDDSVSALANQIASNGPHAVAQAKSLVQFIESRPDEQTCFDYTTAAIADIRVSDEGQEGLAAFLEKREPNWREG